MLSCPHSRVWLLHVHPQEVFGVPRWCSSMQKPPPLWQEAAPFVLGNESRLKWTTKPRTRRRRNPTYERFAYPPFIAINGKEQLLPVASCSLSGAKCLVTRKPDIK